MELNNRDSWYKIMPNDLGKNNCPFCDISKTPLIKELQHWYICYNKYPYGGLKDNLLVVPKRHRKYTYDLSTEEFSELKHVEIFMKDYYKEQDYFSFIRQSTKGRSLEHLHYHYLPGILSTPDIEYILHKNQKLLGKA